MERKMNYDNCVALEMFDSKNIGHGSARLENAIWFDAKGIYVL